MQSLVDGGAWEVVAVEKEGENPKHLLKCLADGRLLFKRMRDFQGTLRRVVPDDGGFSRWRGCEVGQLYAGLLVRTLRDSRWIPVKPEEGHAGDMDRLWNLAECFCRWAAHAIDWQEQEEVWPYVVDEFSKVMFLDLLEDPGLLDDAGLEILDWRGLAPWFTRVVDRTEPRLATVKHHLIK